MEKKLRVLMIGAHPDDNDICGGGLALKYARLGHSVKFLSVCNGCGGHHKMQPKEIAERRYGETQKVAALAGIEYDVWDIPDCEVMADLETRKRLITYIRKFNGPQKRSDARAGCILSSHSTQPLSRGAHYEIYACNYVLPRPL